MIESVVVATDGSASVERAVLVATDLAERFDATVHALYVVEEGEVENTPDEFRAAVRESHEERGEAALKTLAEGTDATVTTAIVHGHPASEIVSYAHEVSADIVAIGTRGRHGEHRLLLGSVAEDVVRRCSEPVLTVRQLDEREGSASS